MNLSVFDDMTDGMMAIRYVYIVLGAVAVFCNAIILVVYLSKKKFYAKSILIVGLATADLVNGVAFLLTGKFLDG